jgi:DNA recombination protein RmuC
LKAAAKSLSEKYLAPPATTDFGILFLPTEGFMRKPSAELALLSLSSASTGSSCPGRRLWRHCSTAYKWDSEPWPFRRRYNEVWQLLGAAKTEFGKYADVLSKVKKKLDEASTTIDKAAVRSRAIERTLRSVEAPNDRSAILP